MNTKHTTRILRALTLAALLGLSNGAHALCVNADGSLDDHSMDTAAIDRGLLPSCEVQVPATAIVSEPRAVKADEPVAKPAAPAPKSEKKAKRPEKTAASQEDCRTANGESRNGTLGAVDLLPACGV